MSSQVSVTAAFKRCVLRKKNGCMCTQVSVTAAFKSCGKKEVRYLPTLTHRSCHELDSTFCYGLRSARANCPLKKTNVGVVGAFGKDAAECEIQRPFQANLTL